MTSGCLAGSVLRRQCPGTPRHKAAGGGGIWRPVRSEETRPVRLQQPRGELSESPKFCCCVPPARRPLGCVQMAGRERGHSCKAESWAGREPLSPQPPPSSRGGDELRRLRLRLLPLLSLGEGPGQGCAIVLPGSCEAAPRGATSPAGRAGPGPGAARRGDSQGHRFGPATARACAPGGDKVSHQSHSCRDQGLLPALIHGDKGTLWPWLAWVL